MVAARSRGLHNLAHMIVGSEGTLALVTEAELDLVPRPKVRGLLVPHFASLAAAMDALPACLELGPSAVELLDHMMIALARQNLSYREQTALIRGEPAMLFMVEFSSDQPAEVDDRLQRLEKRLHGVSGVEAVIRAVEPSLREQLWNLRQAGMPLLYGMKGDRKPVTFVEDTAVAPARLAEYTSRFRDLLRRNGTDGAFYGHASVGCLHIRPLLNLKAADDVARMRHIAEQVTDLVLEFGGSLSGEHGDGLARSEWNRKMFGPVVYEAFRQVKHAFDPHNLLNPGKVVDAPAMTENLRYPPDYRPVEPATIFDYRSQEGFVRSIELCNGNGLCRKQQGGVMCPSFRATLDENDSTRGRANALRLALVGESGGQPAANALVQGAAPNRPLREKWVHDILDLCLMCKACKSECPSNVDMAKLKAEFLEFYYQDRSRPWGQGLMARIHAVNRLAAPVAPLVNWLQNNRIVRWLLEKIAGIDRRRSMPPLHANHFRRWFARRALAPSAGSHGRVLLLDDCFNSYNEPEIGRAAVTVLERAGYSVELAGLVCCCRPLISKGFLREARDLIQKQALGLARRLNDGSPLLGLEPSCILTLADEWTELVPSPETKRIAAAAELADAWLARQMDAGNCELKLQPLTRKCVVHGHCHQKALRGMAGTAAALRLIPGLNVQVLDTGCCGMAGSFGFEREHYDLSVKIAGLSLLPALAAEPEAIVVAPGTSCRHQIKDLTDRRALHPLELLAVNSKPG
jgi:Fe-S oxidoreductase